MIAGDSVASDLKARWAHQTNNEAPHTRDSPEVVVTLDPDSPKLNEARIRRKKFVKYGVRLYQAALDGDWEKASRIFEKDRSWITAPITKHEDTVLHIAAASKHPHFVTKLLGLMIEEDLEITNTNRNTAFCFAASSGNVDIAKVMVKKNQKLPNIKGNANMTPLLMAILLRHRPMVDYLMDVTNHQQLKDHDRIALLTSAVEAGLFELALKFIKERPDLALLRNSKKKTVLHTLATQRHLHHGTNMGNDRKDEKQLALALQVTEIAWKRVIEEDEDDISDLIGYPSRLLFVAAKIGNVDFLRTLIIIYPDVIWKVDEKRRSIFHIAIKYRHEEIFKLIHEIGTIKDFVATYMDDQGNNMLHLAAKIAPPHRLNCVSGAALQMQRELLWFKAVKEVVQPQYVWEKNNMKKHKIVEDRSGSFKSAQNDDVRSESEIDEVRSESLKSAQNDEYRSDESESNEDNSESENDEDKSDSRKTPQALFSKQHEKLRLQGEEWMKKTAESCTLVATLITTVVFTAAFTLPGGTDDKDGTPILLKKLLFKVFAISNAVSLFASTTSILMFLSILTSRYAEHDFIKVLPFKLMVGLTSLFVSIATMMVAFTVTFFITFQRDSIWIPAPIVLLAVIPVLLFGFQQSPLISDIYCSTYRSWTLFQPSDKRKLCWNNKRLKQKCITNTM
ncbi:uncharacterized protein [Spinacia oleracea]|uniref:PGG domain-containing protein n=1 Tax=Spinacia oleracea TaxID=3562 RepID=A0A9R0J7A0_SPIOL|nr:uncharacterized protein LOC110800315 [Spinacia oleracea]